MCYFKICFVFIWFIIAPRKPGSLKVSASHNHFTGSEFDTGTGINFIVYFLLLLESIFTDNKVLYSLHFEVYIVLFWMNSRHALRMFYLEKEKKILISIIYGLVRNYKKSFFANAVSVLQSTFNFNMYFIRIYRINVQILFLEQGEKYFLYSVLAIICLV